MKKERSISLLSTISIKKLSLLTTYRIFYQKLKLTVIKYYLYYISISIFGYYIYHTFSFFSIPKGLKGPIRFMLKRVPVSCRLNLYLYWKSLQDSSKHNSILKIPRKYSGFMINSSIISDELNQGCMRHPWKRPPTMRF